VYSVRRHGFRPRKSRNLRQLTFQDLARSGATNRSSRLNFFSTPAAYSRTKAARWRLWNRVSSVKRWRCMTLPVVRLTL